MKKKKEVELSAGQKKQIQKEKSRTRYKISDVLGCTLEDVFNNKNGFQLQFTDNMNIKVTGENVSIIIEKENENE